MHGASFGSASVGAWSAALSGPAAASGGAPFMISCLSEELEILRQVLRCLELLLSQTLAPARLVWKRWKAVADELLPLSRFRNAESTCRRRLLTGLVEREAGALERLVRLLDRYRAPGWAVPDRSASCPTSRRASRARGSAAGGGDEAAAAARRREAARAVATWLLAAIEDHARPAAGGAEGAEGADPEGLTAEQRAIVATVVRVPRGKLLKPRARHMHIDISFVIFSFNVNQLRHGQWPHSSQVS
eukprot:tig00001007_g6238.t1